MIILTCCITILITYILIFGLLTYYFIKKRLIWNELFSINSIIDTLIEIFSCPEHFLIYIPGLIFENTSCVEKTRIKYENKEQIRIVLTKINIIIHKMTDVEVTDVENNSIDTNTNITNKIKNIKWILEGTMDNFNHMYEETAEFYTKLSGSYTILNENENENKSSNSKSKSNTGSLENLVVLENNIEYCDSILKLLESIDFEKLFQIENKYMLLLIYNLIENIKIYKIIMYKIINF
jgi:hypothetical protein